MSAELVPISQGAMQVEVLGARDFMPVFDIKLALERRNALVQFTQQIMVDGLDYGKIPGSTKPSLMKAGAEKLCTFFGLVAEFALVESIEDWSGRLHGEPLFYYRYKCKLSRQGRLLGEGEGSCNSWESKYRYRWVDESYIQLNGMNPEGLLKRGGAISEFDFAVDKAETGGKYGKPAEYWQAFKDAIANGTARKIEKKMRDSKKPAWEIDGTQYRIPNPDIPDIVNTGQKMAQKRSLVAATLISVNASEYFTQDVEDLAPGPEYSSPAPQHSGHDEWDTTGGKCGDIEPPRSKEAAKQVAARKIEESKPAPFQLPDFATFKATIATANDATVGNCIRQLKHLLTERHGEMGKMLISSVLTGMQLSSWKDINASQLKEAATKLYKELEAADKTTVEVVPPEVRAIWSHMTDISSTVKEFQYLKEVLGRHIGIATAETEYRGVLSSHGVVHSNEFKGADGNEKARSAARQLWELIASAEKDAEGITDADVPR